MNLEETKELIKLEHRIRGENPNETYYSIEFYMPCEEEMEACKQEFGVDWYTNYLFESYCGYTSRYINAQLKSDKPINEFAAQYSKFLIRELNQIESCNFETVWRWHVYEDEFNYLSSKINRVVEFPEFKSTSLIKKNDGLFFRIQTSEQSNGKKVYKHIDKDKSNAEKEIIFLPNSKFLIQGVNNNIIEMEERNDLETDILARENYELN